MISTRKKRQSNRSFLSQLDDFDQDVIFGEAMSNRQDNTMVNEGTADQEFTVGNSDGGPAINENMVKVKILEGCLNERIGKEMGNLVYTVENKSQNAILTSKGSIVTLKTELTNRSRNASSRRDATSVMASSERGETIKISALFENVSERNNTLRVLNTNDETKEKILDEVSKLSVPDTHFDRNHTVNTDVACEQNDKFKNVNGSESFPDNITQGNISIDHMC